MAKTYGIPNASTAKSINNTNKGNIELCVISHTKKYMQRCNVVVIKKERSRSHDKVIREKIYSRSQI